MLQWGEEFDYLTADSILDDQEIALQKSSHDTHCSALVQRQVPLEQDSVQASMERSLLHTCWDPSGHHFSKWGERATPWARMSGHLFDLKNPCFSFCFPVLVLMKPLLPMESWWYVSFSQKIFCNCFLNIKEKRWWEWEKPVGQFLLFLTSFPFRYFENGIFYYPVHCWYPIISHLCYTSPHHTDMHTRIFPLVPVLLQKMYCFLSKHSVKKTVNPLANNLPSPFLPWETSHAWWVSSALSIDLS